MSSAQSQVQNRVPWVDAAKGISIFLVVMVHAVHWLGSAGMDAREPLNEFMSPLVHVRMPLFFFASGLFASKWLESRWSTLLRSKVALLVWTFLIWQSAVFAYKVIGGTVLPEEDGGILGQVARVLVSPIRPNGELWFLWALVLFFIVGRAARSLPPVVTVAVAAVVSVLWSGVTQPLLGDELIRLLGPGLSTFPMYFVYFIGAALFSGQIRAVVSRTPLWVAVLVAIAWVVAFWWLDVLALLPPVPGLVFLGQVTGIIGGVAFAVLLQWFKPLVYLGRHTLEVYLTHTLFIVLMACGLHLGGVSITGWASLVVAVVAISLGLLLGRVAGGTWLFESPRWFERWIAGDLRARAIYLP